MPKELVELKPVSMFTDTFCIPDMDCHVEEDLIRKNLGKMPGVKYLGFDIPQRKLTVKYSSPASLENIRALLREIGMNPKEGVTEAPQSGIPWRKLVIGCALAAFSELAELLASALSLNHNLGMAASCIFAILAIAFVGLGTFKKGWRALATGNLNINALMAVAVSGAVCIGQFPEAAMVMVLFEISEALEARAMNQTRAAIKKLLDLSPRKVEVRMADGAWKEEDVEEVRPGDVIRVRPGEKIGMDGKILRGGSSVNQAPITGESMPVEKKPGDIVYAGTINESGSFEFEATAEAKDTTLARIIRAVENAQATKAPVQRFVDAFARYYTPAIFALAILAAVFSLLALHHSWHESIYSGLVILVIGCPCALVISTPVSIVSALSRAAGQGILIKGGSFLEAGKDMDYLALDKTGTITWGRPELVEASPCGEMDMERALELAASLASRSDHPVSRAIARNAHAKNLALQEVEDFRAIPGRGVEGKIGGRLYKLGNKTMLAGKVDAALEGKIAACEKNGETVAILAADSPLAIFAAADAIKPSSMEAFSQLRKMGVKTLLLSGDNNLATAAVAKKAGVDEFLGSLLPEQKMAEIDRLRASGHKVGMAGDGINDAPALAKADIGFAMAGAGTDTAIETADVALMDDDLRKIPRFIQLSRSAKTIIIENISFALGIKAIVFALALCGLATMWMAVLADVGATLLVVANGMRLLRK